MPKDEFDFEDPFELNGMAFLSHEDTTDDMTDCFIEEFLRIGYNHKQVLALFRNPHYLGPNLALQKRGEPFIRERVAEVFARWGRPVAAGILPAVEPGVPPGGSVMASPGALESLEAVTAHPGGRMPAFAAGEAPAAALVEHDETLTDPMGAPIPKLNL